jgi:hypothetical protein
MPSARVIDLNVSVTDHTSVTVVHRTIRGKVLNVAQTTLNQLRFTCHRVIKSASTQVIHVAARRSHFIILLSMVGVSTLKTRAFKLSESFSSQSIHTSSMKLARSAQAVRQQSSIAILRALRFTVGLATVNKATLRLLKNFIEHLSLSVSMSSASSLAKSSSALLKVSIAESANAAAIQKFFQASIVASIAIGASVSVTTSRIFFQAVVRASIAVNETVGAASTKFKHIAASIITNPVASVAKRLGKHAPLFARQGVDVVKRVGLGIALASGNVVDIIKRVSLILTTSSVQVASHILAWIEEVGVSSGLVVQNIAQRVYISGIISVEAVSNFTMKIPFNLAKAAVLRAFSRTAKLFVFSRTTRTRGFPSANAPDSSESD